MAKRDDTSHPSEAAPREQGLLMAGGASATILGQLLALALTAEIGNSAIAWMVRSALLVGCLAVLALIANPRWVRIFRRSRVRIEVPTGISHAPQKRKERLGRLNNYALIFYLVTVAPITSLYYLGATYSEFITTVVVYILAFVLVLALIGAIVYRIRRRSSWRVLLRFVRRYLIHRGTRHNQIAYAMRRWRRDPYH